MAKRKSDGQVAAPAPSAHVISVYGPFNSRALVDMPVAMAEEIFGDQLLSTARRATVIEAAERDVALIRKRDPELADSALAASMVALAFELEHPFNSATSKSMCAKALMDAAAQLRELAPPAEEKDQLDDIATRRDERRARTAGGATAEGPPGS